MNDYEILAEAHRRLRRVAERVVAEAEAAGDAEHPLCGLEPHLIRALRRELQHEPQPSSFATMSIT